MGKCIIIVRSHVVGQSTDADLIQLKLYYKSPVLELDWEGGWDKAIDVFEMEYRKHFLDFFDSQYTVLFV